MEMEEVILGLIRGGDDLIINGEMIWGKSSRKIRQIIQPFDADYRMK